MPPTAVPPQSSLSEYIASSTPKTSQAPIDSPPLASPSQLSTSDALPLEILHNLRHQHSWTSLHLHPCLSSSLTPGPLTSTPSLQSDSSDPGPLHQPPVTLLSGLPPRLLYVHPDRQFHLLSKGLRDTNLSPELEWVLPIALETTEKRKGWTLRRLAAVFDALPERETWPETVQGSRRGEGREKGKTTTGTGKGGGGDGDGKGEQDQRQEQSPRRDAKRVVLAMLADRGKGGDGTIVYYIMQEGDVKPRQN